MMKDRIELSIMLVILCSILLICLTRKHNVNTILMLTTTELVVASRSMTLERFSMSYLGMKKKRMLPISLKQKLVKKVNLVMLTRSVLKLERENQLLRSFQAKERMDKSPRELETSCNRNYLFQHLLSRRLRSNQ